MILIQLAAANDAGSSDGPAATHQIDHKHHHRNHQQQVYEAASHVEAEAKKP
jgi:hypothetical protein